MPSKNPNGYKIQTAIGCDWEDLVDSDTKEPEIYPTRKVANDDVKDMRQSLDGTRGQFRVVSVDQDRAERSRGNRMIGTVCHALGI
jgi:hypothetical protein